VRPLSGFARLAWRGGDYTGIIVMSPKTPIRLIYGACRHELSAIRRGTSVKPTHHPICWNHHKNIGLSQLLLLVSPDDVT
jgi:hypothetical protein